MDVFLASLFRSQFKIPLRQLLELAFNFFRFNICYHNPELDKQKKMDGFHD